MEIFVLSFQVYHRSRQIAFLSAFPSLKLSLNPGGKPKRGSFEIILVKSEEVLLWSGAEKGPPRKLKFPDAAKVVEMTKKHL